MQHAKQRNESSDNHINKGVALFDVIKALILLFLKQNNKQYRLLRH
ncbi:hypothetical protein [Pseudoalteromonas luteoviolacea]|nr:hypothetical protein [Pseudoalteromonas luteoviolacea]